MLVDFLCRIDDSRVVHSLLTTSSSSQIVSPIREKGIVTFEPERRFHYDPVAILEMARWLRSQKIQVVHGYNEVGNAWGNLAAMLARVPVYVSGEHGSVWRVDSGMYWLNRFAYRRANIAVVNSRASKQLVCHRYGIDSEKVKVIYNIVVPPANTNRERVRASLGLGDEVVIGSIARLVPHKGFPIMVDAAKEVLQTSSNVRFLLVGGGEQESYLREYIRNKGISDKFVLTGWRDDARDLLPAFDIFVSTSLHEAFGNVLIEAALAGIPVIAPRVDGIPEAVVDGYTGRLIEPTMSLDKVRTWISHDLPKRVVVDGHFKPPLALDPVKLADEIRRLIDDPALRTHYGEAGRERARELFSFERYRRELEEVYRACLSAPLTR